MSTRCPDSRRNPTTSRHSAHESGAPTKKARTSRSRPFLWSCRELNPFRGAGRRFQNALTSCLRFTGIHQNSPDLSVTVPKMCPQRQTTPPRGWLMSTRRGGGSEWPPTAPSPGPRSGAADPATGGVAPGRRATAIRTVPTRTESDWHRLASSPSSLQTAESSS